MRLTSRQPLTLAAAGRIEHNSLFLFLSFQIAKKNRSTLPSSDKNHRQCSSFSKTGKHFCFPSGIGGPFPPTHSQHCYGNKSTHTVGSEDNAPGRRAYKAGTRMKTRVSSARKDSLWHFIKVSLLTFYSPRVSYSLHSGQDAL